MGVLDVDKIVATTEVDDQFLQTGVANATFNQLAADQLVAAHTQAGQTIGRHIQLSGRHLVDAGDIVRIVEEEKVGLFVLVNQQVRVDLLKREFAFAGQRRHLLRQPGFPGSRNFQGGEHGARRSIRIAGANHYTDLVLSLTASDLQGEALEIFGCRDGNVEVGLERFLHRALQFLVALLDHLEQFDIFIVRGAGYDNRIEGIGVILPDRDFIYIIEKGQF